ncbi:unnamed protein product [Rotaria sordida]|uniref:Helix-turn-helix domain-containing protein n=1 Tax=Rotaria sordida TaxID=392033 RepID=A0A819U528_9BILA|nr:unnamed protein product [Rotaria sordida]
MAACDNDKKMITTVIDLTTNEESDDEVFHDGEWYATHFNILTDEDDEDREDILEEYNQDFDFDTKNTIFNEETLLLDETTFLKTNMDHETEINNEQVLSQKLSQISINNAQRSWDDDDDEEKQEKHLISDYDERLNDLFDKIMMEQLSKITTTLSIDNLRELAILKHHIAKIDLQKKLWNIYLKSGTGQWETSESMKTNVDRCIWPIPIQNMIISRLNKSDTSESNDEQFHGKKIVIEHLQVLNDKLVHKHTVYNEKKQESIGLTDELEKSVENFVKQYSLVSYEMKLNYEMKILAYDYDDQLLERTYLQLNPTKYQIQVAQRLFDLRYIYVLAKQDLIELKQHICYQQPTQLIHAKALSSVSNSNGDLIQDANIFQQELNREEKELQVKMTDLMSESIAEAEKKIVNDRNLYNEEVLRIANTENNTNENFPELLMNIIVRRIQLINKKLEYISKFRLNYFLRHQFDDIEDVLALPSVRFSPSLIIDTPLHLFTVEQIKLLNRGPTYVPPCQMYISSLDMTPNLYVEKTYHVLQHHLNILYNKYNVNMVQRSFISKKIQEAYKNAFSITLPISLQQRARHEKQLIQSIQDHLKENNLILQRIADQCNVFYLGYRPDFEEKANEYMKKTDRFELCEIIDDNNLQATRTYLTNKIKSLNADFQDTLHGEKFKDMLDKIYINIDKVELSYLYFQPDVSENYDLSVQPVVIAQYTETTRLAHFLDQLLRPVVQRELELITFKNGADFIRKFNNYIEVDEKKNRLRPTTNFIVVTISNFYHMADHDTFLQTLQDFLTDPCHLLTIQNVPIGKIYRLTSLFLHHNRFYYDHKIYRFAKGAPMNYPLTRTLAYIYILHWLKSLFRHPFLEQEFVGRYENQLFFTWNKANSEFVHMIKAIERPNIEMHINVSMSSHVRFLDAYIENQNGILYTRVDHDSTLQKYTLPYVIGNAKAKHSHWLRSSLIRAVRYCTSVDDFNRERIYLETTCLTNGYSLEFIEKRIEHFFQHFDAVSLRTNLDGNVYRKLRLRLMNFISEQRRISDQKRELEKNHEYIQLSYVHEIGSRHVFNQELKKILSVNLDASNATVKQINLQKTKQRLSKNVKASSPITISKSKPVHVQVTTKQQYSLNALLSQQKPSHPLLNQKGTFFST